MFCEEKLIFDFKKSEIVNKLSEHLFDGTISFSKGNISNACRILPTYLSFNLIFFFLKKKTCTVQKIVKSFSLSK